MIGKRAAKVHEVRLAQKGQRRTFGSFCLDRNLDIVCIFKRLAYGCLRC